MRGRTQPESQQSPSAVGATHFGARLGNGTSGSSRNGTARCVPHESGRFLRQPGDKARRRGAARPGAARHGAARAPRPALPSRALVSQSLEREKPLQVNASSEWEEERRRLSKRSRPACSSVDSSAPPPRRHACSLAILFLPCERMITSWRWGGRPCSVFKSLLVGLRGAGRAVCCGGGIVSAKLLGDM